MSRWRIATISALFLVSLAVVAYPECKKQKFRLWLCNTKTIDCTTCMQIGDGGWTGCATWHAVPWTKQVCDMEVCPD